MLLLLLLLLFFFGREGLHASTGLEKSSEELTLISMPLSTHSAAQLLSARLHLLAVSRLGGALTQGDPEHGATDEPDGTLITLITLSSHPLPQAELIPDPACLHFLDGFNQMAGVLNDDGLCLVLSRL